MVRLWGIPPLFLHSSNSIVEAQNQQEDLKNLGWVQRTQEEDHTGVTFL